MVENSREALVELAERVEKAEGADSASAEMRTLNSEVLRALGWRQEERDIIDPDGRVRIEVPYPVGSIDAAMTIVPEGCRALIDSDGCHCRLTNAGDESWPWNGFTGLAGTMAQAIVAAALRARSADLA